MSDSLVSRLSRHLRPVLFCAALLAGAGALALVSLRRDIEPHLKSGYAVVTATLPGASAGELSETVAKRIGETLRGTPGVEDFTGRTADGFVVLTVKFDRHAGDPVEIRERLRSRLAELRENLSGGIVGLTGPRIADDAAAPFDLVAGLPAKDGDMAALRAAIPGITRALKTSPLVGAIDVAGLPADRVVVEYRDAELADAGFTPQLVAGLLKTQSFVAPGGYFDDNKSLAGVHTDALLKSLDELKAVGILDPVTGRATALDRILDVKVEPRTPPAPSVTVDGLPGVRIAVAKSPGADARAFSAFVRSTLEAKTDKSAVVLLDNAAFVHEDYRGFADGLIAGGLALAVLLVPAMGARAGAIVALTVPLVILSTLATLALLGFTLNIVVLAALTIAAGVVVDNHIVVAQAMSRRLAGGADRNAALVSVFRTLAGPLLAATLVAIAGFLPVLLADHLAGEYLRDIVPVMAIALGFSYVFAFTLTPFLCGKSGAASGLVAKLEHAYGALLLKTLRKPALTLAGAALVTAGGIAVFATRPSSFFPANDRSLLAVEILRPAGTSQAVVAADNATAEARIAATLKETGTETGSARLAIAGGGLPRFSGNMPPAFDLPNAGTTLVAFASPEALATFRKKFADGFAIPGAIVRVRPVGGGPQVAWPVKIVLHGPAGKLAAAATLAEKTLSANRSLTGVHRENGGDIAKWRLLPKRREAADKGVTPADIAMALNATLNGLPAFELGSGDTALPVFVRAKPTSADPEDNLKDAYVYPAKGRPCLLSDVAVVESYSGPACLESRRGEPVVTLVADCAPGVDPCAAERGAITMLDGALRGSGVVAESAGLARDATEATAALARVTPWALAAMFLVILVQTRSFRLNLAVLAVILFGVAGAGLGLAVSGMPAGFMPLIGLTAMAGIAVNVAIVMTASLASAGDKPTDEALARAASDRVEPIVLSVLCAFGGMIPLYVFGGPLWHGMVVTLLSGLALAALLLVFAIPAAFRLLKR